MESLSQLSAIVQSLPDVADEPQIKSENTLNNLMKKQLEQKEQLSSLEQEQTALNKTVKIHQESLVQKRDQLQQLQQKLAEINEEQPVMEVETQVVTLVNPEGLDRNVSNLTLIDQDESENLEDGMEENEEYLEEQERNLDGMF